MSTTTRLLESVQNRVQWFKHVPAAEQLHSGCKLAGLLWLQAVCEGLQANIQRAHHVQAATYSQLGWY
jgi:hypothetical protein